jgi:uncharacterized membrane protein YgcG
MGKKVCRSLLLIVLLATFVQPLRAESPEQVPDPRKASGAFVSDGAGVLAPEYVAMIDRVCRDLQAKTTIELAVVTVGDLGGLTIDEFAEKVFRRFGIGAAGKDNGLLLICARDDRMVRLEVGYGLEAAIPDALASRILDQSGLPYLKNGLFGRGLFMAARAIAGAAASASGAALFVAEPTTWPAEAPSAGTFRAALPAPPPPVQKKEARWDPLLSALYFGAGLLVLAGLGLGWTLGRYGRARGRAARHKAAGGAGPIAVAWTAAVAGFVLLLVKSGGLLASIASMTVVPGLATAGQLLLARSLRRRLSSYRLPCPACGQPMEMASESEEDGRLSTEEVAEEKAGGMDYEFWHCPKCGADEKLSVALGKAAKCPRCGRRTLTSSTTTLVAATREQGGRTRVSETCLNPKCGFSKVREHDTPRLSSPGSSPGGSSRPSSSFGGGRSGGAGASKKF